MGVHIFQLGSIYQVLKCKDQGDRIYILKDMDWGEQKKVGSKFVVTVPWCPSCPKFPMCVKVPWCSRCLEFPWCRARDSAR